MIARAANPGKTPRKAKGSTMKKKRKQGRSAAQKAATKRMLAANRRANPKRKRAKARKSNPAKRSSHRRAARHAHKRASNPAKRRRRNPAKRHHHRARRRNPDTMHMVEQILRPVAFAAIAAAIGLGGSFMLARAQFGSRTKIIGANLLTGIVAGSAVALIDKSDGKAAALVSAVPFLITAGQNMLAGGSTGGATAAGEARATAAASQNVAGLYGERLLGGITVDAFDQPHRLAGMHMGTGDGIGGITSDALQGIAADPIWG